MNANNLVDVIYSVGGTFSLYPDRSGFHIRVPNGALVQLMDEAVARASEVLLILREQPASRENLADAFAALPADERDLFRDFPGGSDRRALEAFGLFASSRAIELIESARPKQRRKRFPDLSHARANKVSQGGR